ncbi:MAG: hypothetical protein AVDCRST_MAG73-2870, partial [uncultured Thermomicrobiales bacterium]
GFDRAATAPPGGGMVARRRPAGNRGPVGIVAQSPGSGGSPESGGTDGLCGQAARQTDLLRAGRATGAVGAGDGGAAGRGPPDLVRRPDRGPLGQGRPRPRRAGDDGPSARDPARLRLLGALAPRGGHLRFPARRGFYRDPRLRLPTQNAEPVDRSGRVRRRADPPAPRLRRRLRRLLRRTPAGERRPVPLHRPRRRRAGQRGLLRVLRHGAVAAGAGRIVGGVAWGRTGRLV